jgi:hypothetical protein
MRTLPGGDDGVVVINDLFQVANRHRRASQLIHLIQEIMVLVTHPLPFELLSALVYYGIPMGN